MEIGRKKAGSGERRLMFWQAGREWNVYCDFSTETFPCRRGGRRNPTPQHRFVLRLPTDTVFGGRRFHFCSFFPFPNLHSVPMADNGKTLTLTDDNFEDEVLNADQPVLVDFWAEWCGPCRQIAPTIEQLAEDFDGRAKVGKLDVDENQRTAMKYNVRSIPTLLFIKDGKVAEQHVGAASKGDLAQKLESLAGQPA